MKTSLVRSLFVRKNLHDLMKAGDVDTPAAQMPELHRGLNAFSLTMLGVGGIIGAGIFSLTGTAAAYYAGPALVFSFVISGILCALAGLCYSEMAAMVPISGSAYSYSYATMGEIVAWIIGWDLILEYAFGAVTVATAWSGYFLSLISKTLGIPLSDLAIRFSKGPWEHVVLNDGSTVFGYWNLPASFIALVAMCILYRGIKESAWVNNIIVVVKVGIVLLFIALGWSVVDTANWIGDASATGLLKMIPQQMQITHDGITAMAYGFPGVLTGAGVVFFAYIGFDALSTTAQETKNPQKDMPIGILASLVICTVLYILMALVMTGVVHYSQLGVPDPVAVGIDAIVMKSGWSETAKLSLTFFVKLGALAGLTSVIMVLCLGQTRIFYAMAKDGLLPWFDQVHPKYHSPSKATVVTGCFVSLMGGFLPMSLVGELVSIGTLLAFVLVCVGVIILRIKEPNHPRPFRVPMYYIIAPAGALSCMWVMSGLPWDTWLRLVVWLIFGFIIYGTYGFRHSKRHH